MLTLTTLEVVLETKVGPTWYYAGVPNKVPIEFILHINDAMPHGEKVDEHKRLRVMIKDLNILFTSSPKLKV